MVLQVSREKYLICNGDCTVGERISVPDYLIENFKKIVKNFRHSGIAEFEYEYDGKNRYLHTNKNNPPVMILYKNNPKM